ncbi:MAG: hypothetical protein PW788_15495 [Micavibrio sp.]|nr:hypothetical protein [Micavibrio sp.]
MTNNDVQADKQTKDAWHAWVVFTQFAAGGVVMVAAILLLMLTFLYKKNVGG